VSRKRNEKWSKHNLSEATLGIGKFRKQYPLESDGLVVALGGVNQLLMASYDKPPLGVTILRPAGDFLAAIARSADDTVKSIDTQDNDIVVVGPLDKISQLELETLRLKPSSAPNDIIKTIYGHASSKAICIVATISARPCLQQATESEIRATTDPLGKFQTNFQDNRRLVVYSFLPPPQKAKRSSYPGQGRITFKSAR
jgi:hypothetical protein